VQFNTLSPILLQKEKSVLHYKSIWFSVSSFSAIFCTTWVLWTCQEPKLCHLCVDNSN